MKWIHKVFGMIGGGPMEEEKRPTKLQLWQKNKNLNNYMQQVFALLLAFVCQSVATFISFVQCSSSSKIYQMKLFFLCFDICTRLKKFQSSIQLIINKN
ncbi:hypothetical protein DERP_011784 [Dermatophagoides pteronyssinus]|uniref:Transmembrane protein n=1 Tax=Dermatophagoides pteronyssinus TaxID=6956 RepID=A0ABQ8JR20_DERPT|nr:hypothetical protein DERP_011784 [Dermatophagoides pteronyssinus]